MYGFAIPGSDPKFETFLKQQLKGKYAKDCLEKIRQRAGTIIMVNTTSRWSKSGEVIHFTALRASRETWFNVRTDDEELEFCQLGPRYDRQGQDLMLRALSNDINALATGNAA